MRIVRVAAILAVAGLLAGLVVPVGAQSEPSSGLVIEGVEFYVLVAGDSSELGEPFNVRLLSNSPEATADLVGRAEASVFVSRPSGSRYLLTFTSVDGHGPDESMSVATVTTDEIGLWTVNVGGRLVTDVRVVAVRNDDGSSDVTVVLWFGGVVAALVGGVWWDHRRRSPDTQDEDPSRPSAVGWPGG